MSFVVHVFEQPADLPVPTTLHEASELVGQLQERSPGPNPRFLALANALLKRYPSLDNDEVDEDAIVWSSSVGADGKAADADADADAVFSIGLVTDWLDESRPFLIEQALRFGLNVYDAQAGECFLKGGKREALATI